MMSSLSIHCKAQLTVHPSVSDKQDIFNPVHDSKITLVLLGRLPDFGTFSFSYHIRE